MIDLTSHLSNSQQKAIGPLLMSDKAGAEMYLILAGHGIFMEVGTFGPVVADTVGKFLGSAYFQNNAWFRNQPVHLTRTLAIKHAIDELKEPIFHLRKLDHGYSIVSCDEAPLPEHYFEERVVEETKVEMGIA